MHCQRAGLLRHLRVPHDAHASSSTVRLQALHVLDWGQQMPQQACLKGPGMAPLWAPPASTNPIDAPRGRKTAQRLCSLKIMPVS